MKLPPLLSSHDEGVQMVLAIVVPAVFGLLTGIVLGVSEIGYLVLSVLGIAGGFFAGLEHRFVPEGAIRGFTGGILFGTFILLGHKVSGLDAKAHLPEPAAVLVVITTVLGIGLGALGARTRLKRAAG